MFSCAGMESCDYHKLFEELRTDFTEFTFAKRRLEQAHLIDCLRTKGMHADLTVPIEAFDAFCLWFWGSRASWPCCCRFGTASTARHPQFRVPRASAAHAATAAQRRVRRHLLHPRPLHGRQEPDHLVPRAWPTRWAPSRAISRRGRDTFTWGKKRLSLRRFLLPFIKLQDFAEPPCPSTSLIFVGGTAGLPANPIGQKRYRSTGAPGSPWIGLKPRYRCLLSTTSVICYI